MTAARDWYTIWQGQERSTEIQQALQKDTKLRVFHPVVPI